MAARENIIGAPTSLPGAPALGGASAEAFGAGIGRGLSSLGGTLHQANVRAVAAERERELDAKVAKAGAGMPELTTRISIGMRDLEEASPEDGAGHVDAARAFVKQETDAFLAANPDPKVRERYAPLVGGLTARAIDDADSYARGLRKTSIPVNYKKGDDGWAARLVVSGDDAELREAMAERAATAGGLNVRPEVRDRLLAEGNDLIVGSYTEGKIEVDPLLALDFLTSKDETLAWLRGHMKPERIKGLIDRAQTEVQVKITAEKQQLTFAEKKTRDDIAGFKLVVAAGDMPKDEVFKGWIAKAEGLGDGSLATELKLVWNETQLRRDTVNWKPANWAERINELEAKGDKRSTDENVRLAVLKKYRPASEARFNQDKFGAAAADGLPAPPIDWANPTREQAAARVSWWNAYKATTGATGDAILSADETAQFRERATQGPAGQMAVAGEVRGLFGAAAGAKVLRQVAPDDRDMQLMVGLPERTAQWYKRGSEALGRNEKLFDKDSANDIWSEYASAIPPEMRDPVWKAAKAIVAGLADEQGLTELSPEEFGKQMRIALHRAVGATGVIGDPASRKGGFVNWSGRKVWIPPTETPDSFARKVSRAKPIDWINANSAADGKGPGGAPYYIGGDGKPVRHSDAQLARLREYQIETTPVIGVYRLVNPLTGGGPVDKYGRPWHFRVDKMP